MFDPLEWKMTFTAPQRLSTTSAWIEHIPFAMALIEMIRPSVLVELGTQRGDSYCAFCQAIDALQLTTKCTGIDTWADDPELAQQLSPEQLLAELRQYHDPLYGRFSTLVQSRFDDALPHFQTGQIDLLHIDGMHDYQSVRHDFESWLPKMSPRGVILFHDSAVRDRPDFGVYQLWDQIAGNYPSFEFLHGHGLAILAVGVEPPPVLLDFLERASQSPDTIRRFYASMGQQITSTKTLLLQLAVLTEHRRQLARWRELTQQPPLPGHPEPSPQDPAPFALALLAESVNIMNDDLQLRAHLARLTQQIQQLEQQLQSLTAENHRLRGTPP